MEPVRIFVSSLLLAALLSSGGCATSSKEPGPPVRSVQQTNHPSWGQAYVLTGSAVRAVIVPAAGGRIIEYSINGRNVLLEKGSGGQTAGYQFTVGQELPGPTAQSRLWTGPYEAQVLNNVGLRVRSEPDLVVGLQLDKEIFIDPESGDLGLAQGLRNISKQESATTLWDRTTCPAGGFVFFRVNKDSQYPAGWALRRTVDSQTLYDGTKPHAAQVWTDREVVVVHCQGSSIELGADPDAGWIAYVRDRWLFIKYFPYSPQAQYTAGGNTVYVDFDREAVQFGPISPEIKLKPGESYEFPEKWTVTELDSSITLFEEARRLLDKIAKSPF